MINTENLKEWVKLNNIENRSIERFWEYVNMYIQEIEDENSNTLKYINLKLMKVNLYKVSLSAIYNHSDVINVFLDISYCDKHIGIYEIVYTIRAEQIDEFLTFEDIHYIWRLTDVYNKSTEIAESALEEGLDENLIARVTGLSYEHIIELKKT
jgi:hypothetical protein